MVLPQRLLRPVKKWASLALNGKMALLMLGLALRWSLRSRLFPLLLTLVILVWAFGCSSRRGNPREALLGRDYLTAARVWCEDAIRHKTEAQHAACRATLKLARESYASGKLNSELEGVQWRYYQSIGATDITDLRENRISELEKKLWTEAARAGDPHAKFTLWQLSGGPEADQLLREAAEGGNAEACYRMGANAKEDKYRKMHWWRLAARQGHLSAMYELAKWHLEADDIFLHPNEAAVLLRRVAEERSLHADTAMGELSRLYLEGQGVPQDFVLAHVWMNLAAAETDAGFSRDLLTEARDRITKHMSTTQVAEAQKLARAWEEQHRKKLSDELTSQKETRR